MYIDANQNAPYIQALEYERNIVAMYARASEGKDGSKSSGSSGKGSESTAEVISTITNDPGGSFGGDR